MLGNVLKTRMQVVVSQFFGKQQLRLIGRQEFELRIHTDAGIACED